MIIFSVGFSNREKLSRLLSILMLFYVVLNWLFAVWSNWIALELPTLCGESITTSAYRMALTLLANTESTMKTLKNM
ncbi:MAG: hypothetical protein FWE95_07495 [Planctomycetaceae bacterium]|nr:hypothetical protein [Planctomycetaceae bacterium]